MATRKTIVGGIDAEALEYTAGKDRMLDRKLAESDCIGSAAHAVMLSRIKTRPPILTPDETKQIIDGLIGIMKQVRKGSFRITTADQDVHLAVEKALTRKAGDAGKKIHTARSRNDQVAVDLRLYGKERLLDVMDGVLDVSKRLFRFAKAHADVPMVGRTHMRPAMPGSVGLWASSFGEGLLDDMIALGAAYDMNDRCPLGSAAGYGTPVPIDRDLTARMLGFAEPVHNVLYAAEARGKCESVLLSACAGVMITLSRMAEDLILYSSPEFGYFGLPEEYCTGSSIMPQKKNPDILELVRARSVRVLSHASAVSGIIVRLPGGYNRDLQETKEPFMEGIETTASSLKMVALLVSKLKINKDALLAGFTPEVFAADEATRLVSKGASFRS